MLQRKYKLITWLCFAALGIFIFRKFLYGGVSDIEELTKEYCNTPQSTKGDELEKIPGYTLKQVQVLIRHGDRESGAPTALPNTDKVPISCLFIYPNEAYQTELMKYKEVIKKGGISVKGDVNSKLLDEREICKPYQLTTYGFLQHLLLGNHLKETYSNFLKDFNVKNDVHILATDTSRTKQSPAALIVGMLYDKIMEAEAKQPIEIIVHRDHVSSAHLLLDELEKPLHCEALASKIKKANVNVAFKAKHTNLYQKLATELSTNVNGLPRFNEIIDVFYTRSCHQNGLPLTPGGGKIPEQLVKQFLELSDSYLYDKFSSFEELLTLSILSQMAKQAMLAVRKDENMKKMVLYSGHDSMIYPFIRILDPKLAKWPPYASRIVFELYTQNDIEDNHPDIISRSSFRIIYNGKVVKNIKFCYSPDKPYMLCPLSEFFRYLSKGFRDFSKYQTPILSELLFTKIKGMCADDDKR